MTLVVVVVGVVLVVVVVVVVVVIVKVIVVAVISVDGYVDVVLVVVVVGSSAVDASSWVNIRDGHPLFRLNRGTGKSGRFFPGGSGWKAPLFSGYACSRFNRKICGRYSDWTGEPGAYPWSSLWRSPFLAYEPPFPLACSAHGRKYRSPSFLLQRRRFSDGREFCTKVGTLNYFYQKLHIIPTL